MRREVKIGIFAVLMIGALWAGIRFLKGFDIFSRNAVYYSALFNGKPESLKARLGTIGARVADAPKDADLP